MIHTTKRGVQIKRRLRLAVTAAAVMAGLVAPGTALAVPMKNDIAFNVRSSGDWTLEPRTTARHKEDIGPIVLKPDDVPRGGLLVRLIDWRTGRPFGSPLSVNVA